MSIRRSAQVAGQYLGVVEAPGAPRRVAVPVRWSVLTVALMVVVSVAVNLTLRALGLPHLAAQVVTIVAFISVWPRVYATMRKRHDAATGSADA